MTTLSQLATDFYGKDPIRGEDACQDLLADHGLAALDVIVPYDAASYAATSRQAELRLKQLASVLGPRIVPHLAGVIRSGPWRSKLLGAACFAGLECTHETMTPLIEILRSDASDIDACRLAIEALGFLGADGWAYELEAYSKSGDWGARSDRGIDKYSFEKLSSYALEAFARFAARARTEEKIRMHLNRLTDFILLREAHLPNRAATSYDLVARHLPTFTPVSIDWLIHNWAKHSDEHLQELCFNALGAIASVRAVRFLLNTAVSREFTPSIRTSASIALGEIRHPQAAGRFAEVLRDPSTDKDHLDWAFSTLYAVPAEWPDLSDYIEQILSRETEPAAQLHYSLTLRGDDRGRTQLVDRLDNVQPYIRWTAALALSRLLASESRQYLDHRAEDAGDDIERCGMLAAGIRAGDEEKASQLHEALQMPWALPQLRTIWKTDILDTFRTVSFFDSRAFDLWCGATGLSDKQIQYVANITKFRPNLQPNTEGGSITSSPSPLRLPTKAMKIFVSYSRLDKPWLERFQRMMSPLIRADRVDLWDDTKIKPGRWRDQIARAMAGSNSALFLVSENFLASEFIMREELPELLRYAEERNVIVLWVLLDECLWEESALAQYQGENAGRSLSGMTEAECTKVIKLVCLKVRDLLETS